MNDIKQARRFFRKIPPSVFDMWILPGVERHGWDINVGHGLKEGWEGFFGGYPLDFWKSADWQECTTFFNPSLFTDMCCRRVNAIIGNAVKGLPTPTADIHNTIDRFWACAAYIQSNGNLPAPLVGCVTPDSSQIDIVDGHHRLAAAIHLELPVDTKVPIWIALPSIS